MTEAARHIHNCTCGQAAPGNLRVVGNESSRPVRLTVYEQLRRDPTHTTTLRNQFSRAMGKRFRELRGLIRKAIIDQDCFGMMNPTTQALPQRRAFDFPRSQDKVEAFMDWLRKQHDQGILEIRAGQQIGEAVENAWTNTYVDSAYQKGIYRARQELVQAGYPVPGIEETGGISQAFNQPFHVDRVGLMYSRVYNDLKGITDSMDNQISRVLSQAMAEGKHPREMAKLLTRTISGPVGDLGLTDTLGRFIPAERRARILARTEVIRAHHSATIQEYKNWGAEGVRVRAEWATAGDARVCPDCAMLEGTTYTLKQAENMIPRHPMCRCIALPMDVTDEGQAARAAEEVVEEVPKTTPSEKSFGGSPKFARVKPIAEEQSGVNETKIVLFEDKSKGVFKPAEGEADFLTRSIGGPLYRREIAAYELDKKLGFNIVPETIEWEYKGRTGSLQRFAEKAETAVAVRRKSYDSYREFTAHFQEVETYRRMKVFDALIDNSDRHHGNWMINEGTEAVIAIDNGASFPSGGVGSIPKSMVDNIKSSVDNMDVSLRRRILDTAEDEIISVLSPILQDDMAVQGVKRRFKHLKRIIKGAL